MDMNMLTDPIADPGRTRNRRGLSTKYQAAANSDLERWNSVLDTPPWRFEVFNFWPSQAKPSQELDDGMGCGSECRCS